MTSPAQGRRRVDDFRSKHGIDEPIEEIDWNSIRWRRESEMPIVVAGPAEADGGTDPPTDRGATRSRGERLHPRVPTWHEVMLERELEELRARHESAMARLARFEGSPLAGPREWARRRVSRS